jgi:hypothetical protein
MPRTKTDPYGAGTGQRDTTDAAPDDDYVAALNVLYAHVADPDERREFALMLGFGEPDTQQRYARGLSARRVYTSHQIGASA